MKKNEFNAEMMKTHTVGIRMTQAEKKALDEYCNNTATTMSKLARRLFSKLIKGEIEL